MQLKEVSRPDPKIKLLIPPPQVSRPSSNISWLSWPWISLFTFLGFSLYYLINRSDQGQQTTACGPNLACHLFL